MSFDRRVLESSLDRLWDLLEQRRTPGADVRRIDQRIWDLFGEEWTVMFTDLIGFSRQTASFGIIHFLQIIHDHRRMLAPILSEHDGILIKTDADSLLLAFRQPHKAVLCAVEMQRACAKENERRSAENQILLSIGIGHGRILRIGAEEIYGPQVNAASKLGEEVGQANEILVTQVVRDAVDELPGIQFLDLDKAVPGSERNFRVKYMLAR